MNHYISKALQLHLSATSQLFNGFCFFVIVVVVLVVGVLVYSGSSFGTARGMRGSCAGWAGFEIGGERRQDMVVGKSHICIWVHAGGGATPVSARDLVRSASWG